jgi:hypothetical protein
VLSAPGFQACNRGLSYADAFGNLRLSDARSRARFQKLIKKGKFLIKPCIFGLNVCTIESAGLQFFMCENFLSPSSAVGLSHTL